MEHYACIFKPVELKMMMAAFSNMETVHVAAYALLLETIGMPESEFQAFELPASQQNEGHGPDCNLVYP